MLNLGRQSSIRIVLVFLFLSLLALASPAVAQIQMGIEISPNNPRPGEQIIVRVTVTNSGPNTVSDLEAEVDYPSGLSSLTSALLSDDGQCPGSCNSGEVAIWELGELLPGSGKTFYFPPVVSTGAVQDQIIDFNGRVFEDDALRVSASSQAIVLTGRIFELAVDADREPVAPGEMLRYEINFGNSSNNTVTTDSELRFPLPAGTTFVEADGNGVLIGNEVIWDLGVLNPGNLGKRYVTVQLNGSLGDGDLVEVAMAEISGVNSFETRRTLQQATTRVATISDLAFSIDMPAQPMRTDQYSPVHVTVTNRSSTVQTNVRTELFFPSGLFDMPDGLFSHGGDCISAISSDSQCDAGETAFWDIGTLPPGEGKTVTLVPFASTSNPNGGLISFFGRGFADATEDFWERRTVLIKADRVLELALDADRERVAPGETLSYELNFGNRSGTATTDSQLRFPVPAGTAFVEADGNASLVGNEVFWDLGALNPGDLGKRYVTVQLNGDMNNGDLIEVDRAEISGISAFETQRTWQQATTRVEVVDSELAFSIDMPAQPMRLNSFSPIHVTVTNRGSTLQTNVRAELYFPSGLADMADSLFSDGGDCFSAISSNSQCDAGETAFWDIGTLPPGAGKTVTLVPFASTSNPDGRLMSFFGRAYADDTPDFWERHTVAVEFGRALELAVDASHEPVAPGETLRYELNFGNRSGTATTDTELRFPVPAGTTFVAADGNGSLVGDEVLWDLGVLNPGDSGKQYVTVQLDGSLIDGDLIEVDMAEMSGVSAFALQQTWQKTTTRVEGVSALAFSIDMPAQPFRADEFSPVHVTVSNRGNTVQTNVRAELYFPVGLDFMSDSYFSDGGDCTLVSSSGSCGVGETAFWDIGTLPPGTGKTVTLIPSADSNNPDGRLMSFYGRGFADNTADYWDRHTVAFESNRALELAVDAEREPIAPGESLRYELTFGNRSSISTTDDTTLRFPIPAGTIFVEADEGAALVNGVVVWDLGTLNPGDSGKRYVTVQLDDSLENGDLIEVDLAEVSGESGLETQRIWQKTTTRVETASDLAFSIDFPVQPMRVNEFGPIHVTVTNRGSTVQTNVRAELYFPSGLNFMDDSYFSDGGDCTLVSSSGSCSAGETAFWNIGILPPGAGRTVTLVPFAPASNPDGRLISFFGRGFGDTTTDFWDRRTLAVEAGRPLELAVDAKGGLVRLGDFLRYELSFGNRGGTATTGTELRFPLPVGTTFQSANGNASLVGDEVVWDLETLNAGDVGRREVELALDPQAIPGDIVEVRNATIRASNGALTLDDDATRLRSDDGIGFDLSIVPSTLLQERELTATLQVSNDSGVTITDVGTQLYYPAGLSSLSDSQIVGGDCSGSTCDPGETVFWSIGPMPAGTLESRFMEPSTAESPLGSLVEFFARYRSTSTEGAFTKGTLAVGNFVATPPPAEREIRISGNGVAIQSGDFMPSVVDGTDFGEIDFTGPTAQVSFMIENLGTGVLSIGGAFLAGSDRFSVINAPASSIGPGAQTDFTIGFSPDNVGSRDATVSIPNNDANENPYIFRIQGEGIDPTGNLMFNDRFEPN